MNYQECKTLFAKAKDKSKGKPLCNNTRLIKEGVSYAIRLHETNVVAVSPRDVFTLNTGGWFTITTKDRINSYSPVRLHSEKRVWVVTDSNGNKSAFYDGIQVDKHGNPLKPKPLDKVYAREKKMYNLVSEYIKGFCKLTEDRKLEDPSSGDCWFCCGRTRDGIPLGEAQNDIAHLFEHLKEQYFVPSLLFNALEEYGCDVPLWWHMIKKGGESSIVSRVLRAYFRKRNSNLLDYIK